MVEGLQRRDWVLMPTKETLDTMYELAKFNETADFASRKNCFEASFPRFDPNRVTAVCVTLRNPREFRVRVMFGRSLAAPAE